MDALDLAQAFLLRAQRVDGSWPYRTSGAGFPEPTCHALLALSVTETAARQRGLEWLLARVDNAGAVALARDGEAHWSTSLALFTFAALDAPAAVRERCAAFLLSWEGIHAEPDPAIPMDTTLRGWPWTSGAFTWIEPTSYALLALKRAGYATHPRVREAERLLLDRICVGGGWNNGNREILGRTLPPMVYNTAWALLALQGAAGAEQAVAEGLAVVERETARYPSTLSLALTALACEIWGRPVAPWVEGLRARQEADGGWREQIHLTALAAAALQAAGGVSNVFRC